ncbi:MAG: hypothetical protein RLW68_08190 [Devosia marina]|uniref:hypothetical protein n=1 Tax=Devosia marina TaxID=2683198 RepID=UPI0032F04A93
MTRKISLSPPENALERRALRILSMVHEMHKAGYHRIRVYPGMNPAGTHWRCHITPASNIAWPSSEPAEWGDLIASYSTGDGERYFGWIDGPGRNARQLAQLFLDRFPGIASAGRGQDREYAGWFVDMLGAAENGRLPVFFADYTLNWNEEEMPPRPTNSDRSHPVDPVDAYKKGNLALQRIGYPGAELNSERVNLLMARIEPFLNWYVAAQNSKDPEGKTYGKIASGIYLEAERTIGPRNP